MTRPFSNKINLLKIFSKSFDFIQNKYYVFLGWLWYTMKHHSEEILEPFRWKWLVCNHQSSLFHHFLFYFRSDLERNNSEFMILLFNLIITINLTERKVHKSILYFKAYSIYLCSPFFVLCLIS